MFDNEIKLLFIYSTEKLFLPEISADITLD